MSIIRAECLNKSKTAEGDRIMFFGWMLVIGYILLSLTSALLVYGACAMAKRSSHELAIRRRHAVTALDDWRKVQMRSLQVAVHPNVLIPRKGGN
jgi:hypothetical protein